MNDPALEPNVEPAVPSFETDKSGGAAFDCASFSMTPAASSPAFEMMSSVRSTPLSAFEISWPPAPEYSALIQTVEPSYLLASTPIWPPLAAAASMIWSHVTGWLMSMPAFSTNDLRDQSTCVFDQNGKTTSLPPQVAAAVAPLKDWSVSCDCMSSGIGAKNPASANSAVNGGSIDIRSMPESCAASRLASWMRCWLASCGRTCVLIVYFLFFLSLGVF